ncbi:DinB family protein [Streptomyces sp. AJS327]|uniref:DinB family protein n=1 Tax=Streptomyces sp. AJS327 TaxID=2545265 RepID=UPI0015DF63E5|nr:DinB family protein [Streptomyces sp. AJS327]MBA0052888.1 DinB family protein [Streptomyces sp. AJS327]
MTMTPESRPMPPLSADERATLEGWLDFHRATLELKCVGLDDQQARTAAAEPSTMTLLGLVQHLAEMERFWFQRVFAVRDVPSLYGDDSDEGFELVPGRGLDEALTTWRAEVEEARKAIAGAELDALGRFPSEEAEAVGAPGASLRWILVHMIEEYARHNGHADLLRERVDGTTGA